MIGHSSGQYAPHIAVVGVSSFTASQDALLAQAHGIGAG